MPPRIHPPARAITSVLRCKRLLRLQHQYATAAAAIAPILNAHDTFLQASSALSTLRYPPTQPPSYKPPEFRKSQLLRQYASLIRSTPLMLLFQHNNLKSTEWVGIRRELSIALRKVDDARAVAGYPAEGIADGIKIQIIQTGIFEAALKIVDFLKLGDQQNAMNPSTPSSANNPIHNAERGPESGYTLSPSTHTTISTIRKKHPLTPLLSGPLVLVTFPTVSPEHLKAVLSILSPSPPRFSAPTRRANPGYHDAAVQNGIQKLLLLGARVEGKVFDVEGTKWVGGIEGGMEGLRAQLVYLLTGVGAGVTRTLEGMGRSLWFTVEGRRGMLEEDGQPAQVEEENKDAVKAE